MSTHNTFYVPTPPAGVGLWHVRVDFLSGSFYRLLFRTNARDDSYYFDLADDSGVAQVRHRRIVLANDILAPWRKYRDTPQGILSVVDLTGTGNEPTFETLGIGVKLRYTLPD